MGGIKKMLGKLFNVFVHIFLFTSVLLVSNVVMGMDMNSFTVTLDGLDSTLVKGTLLGLLFFWFRGGRPLITPDKK